MSKKPSHELYVVQEGKDPDDRAWWHKVGAAWPTARGDGYNVQIPPGIAVSGNLVLVPKKDDRR